MLEHPVWRLQTSQRVDACRRGVKRRLRYVAPPEASIVVPTRDRPVDLDRCLAALAGQTGLALVELIVVDDGSSDGETIAQVVGKYKQARLLRLDGQGAAAARNAGAEAARAPVICFTDDDCEPKPDWASRLVQAISAGAPAAGGTSSVDRDSRFAAASGVIARSLQDPEPGLHPHETFASTANLAARADIVRNMPFDEGYRLASSEDRDWCARLTKAGLTLARVPEAVVIHYRNDKLIGFWRRYRRLGEGSYRFRRAHSGGRPARPGYYGGIVREGFRKGVIVGLLVCVSQLATAVGYLRGALAARRH
jgi:glycosyltransferase involved in cell wall biosynthesis